MIGPDKEAVAPSSGEQPDVRFTTEVDGDYDIGITCNQLNPNNAADSAYYFFLALAAQPKVRRVGYSLYAIHP